MICQLSANFIAFMYAHALFISLFLLTKPNTTNVKHELKSLISVFCQKPA